MRASKVRFFGEAIAAVIVVMAFLLLSCERRVIIKEVPAVKEPPPEEVPVVKEVIDHFALGESYWRQGEYEKALAAYDRYLEKYPLGDRVRDALARKATIYYNRSQYGEALPLFLQVIGEYPLDEKRAELHLLLVKTYFHLKQYPESRLSALRWLELHKDHPGKEEVFYLLGQDLMELDYPARVLYWWLKVLESPLVTRGQKEEVRSQLLDLIHEAAEDELREMATYAEGSDLAFPIYYQLALSYFGSNELEEAREAAIQIVRLMPEEEWTAKAEELLQKIEARLKVRPNVIGCLLPLSGPFAMYGQEVLDGLELGLDIFGEGGEGAPSLKFVIRDTKGELAVAIDAIRELAEEERAIVALGPLISKVAEGVVVKAQEFGMPIVTFSQSEGITSTGGMVFQNCLTAEDQLRALIDKAMGEMGLKRFAILYPANAYGRYFMDKLWDKVEARGGMITAVESYEPRDTDFGTQIKKMVGLFYPRPESETIEEEEGELEEGQAELGGEDEAREEKQRPIIDFDAVFIPDSYERAALIGSQLAYYDVVGVRLLGTDLWNSPGLIEIGGEYVRGALFPSGFFPGSGYKGVDSFVDRYRGSFGKEPGLLAAIGYDTMRIIKDILVEGKDTIRTREDFRVALAAYEGLDGVTGSMVFDENRTAKRDPLLLTVVGTHFLPMP